MCTFFGLAQIILSTADDYVVSVLNEVFYQIFQIQQTWTAMYQCNIVHTKRCLQHCHLVELVEYNAGICITFYINNDTHTFTVGFVISIGNTFNFLFVGQIGYILEGLIIASDNIDEVIKIIRAAKTPNDAISGLMERFQLSEIQSRAIVEMRLRQLTGLMQDQLHAEYVHVLWPCANHTEYGG